MRTTTIGEIGEIFDGPHATPTRQRTGKFFLNISSLKSGRLDLDASDRVSDEHFIQWTRRVTPREGDLLFSYETRLGEAALMPAGIDACLGRRMALIRSDRSIIDPRFLLYYWLSSSFQNELTSRAVHGATVSRILLSDLGQWPIRLPELSTQVAIGEVLGALDDKIAANRRTDESLDNLSSGLVRRAAIGGEGAQLGQLAIFLARGIAPKYSEDGLLVVNQKCIRNGQVNLAQARFSSSKPSGKEKYLSESDVLVNSTGQGTLGRVARWLGAGQVATVDTHVSIVRINPDLADPTFVGTMACGEERRIEDLAEGSTGQTELKRDQLATLELSLPSLNSQREIGAQVRELDALATAVRRESAILARTRDELLPLLMDGRITVKDAERAAEPVL